MSHTDRGALAAGTQVGSYRIERPLAEGGMGTVYEAVHVVLPRRAAVKVMHRDLLDKWSARERLFQEARILEELDHPGLVRIYDVGVLYDGRPWIAMELLEGLTVAQRLSVRGKLDALEVIDLVDRTLAALEAAHRAGVIHRDLKPENIVLCRTSCGLAVRVIDWGIARLAADPPGRLTRANMTPGTPLYMSPEQARGKNVDGASDVYAVGVIAYEVLTGLPPFVGDSPLDVVIQHLTTPPPPLRSRRPEVPEALDRLILAMLEKESRRRPSIGAIRSALAVIADDLRDASYEEVSIEMEIEVDDELEPLAGLHHPRWTPLIEPIVPRPGHTAVAGEIRARALDRHSERSDPGPIAGEVVNPATSPGARVARDLH